MPTSHALSHFLSDEQIGALPDQRVGQSWVFEPNIRLRSKLEATLLGPTLDQLCYTWQASYTRKRSPKEQVLFRECGATILNNLLRAHVKRAGMPVGVASQKQRLDRESRYRPEAMSTHRFRLALEWLKKTGLIEITSAGYQFGENAQTARYALTPEAVDVLRPEQLSLSDFFMAKRHETVLLKDTEKRLTKYDDTPVTRSMRDTLALINDSLEQASITTIRPLEVFDLKDGLIGGSKHLYRVFNNNSFEQGGRFYGGWWQHIRSGARRGIRIDGQPTVEVDYAGFNPAVLLIKMGRDVPADPYTAIPGVTGNAQLRVHAKATLAAFLNAKTLHISEPRDFDTEAHGQTKEDFRASILATFPIIKDTSGTNMGLRLQRDESDLAEQVMLHFIERGEPILPIHDAFIVKEHLHDELAEVMKTRFEQQFGQIPTIKSTFPINARG